MPNLTEKRILIVDDNPNIHKDFNSILKEAPKNNLDDIQQILFDSKGQKKKPLFSLSKLKIDSAYQGKEAAELVKISLQENQPYALAFVDIRMPPGWDGINTIKEIWKIDSSIQIVICTAYSDYSWQDMFDELQGSENFLILKKPFDNVEVRQLISSLTKKWEYKRCIQNQIEHLETVIFERTEELRHALQLAKDSNSLKNKFLGNVSFELRTPLNSIIGLTELMCHGKADVAHHKEYYNDILSSAKYLLQMMDDIFDMSKLESDTISLNSESVNLDLLISEIKDMFQPMTTAKKIELDTDVDPTISSVLTDPIKLKQVLRHYVSNAVKFTPDGGKITIRATPYTDGKFQVEVIDTGIGIREQDIDKLFIPFQQLDLSMSKKYHGTGLGLALSRRIAKFQGGSVGVRSTFGKGSTFYVILPLKPMHDVRR